MRSWQGDGGASRLKRLSERERARERGGREKEREGRERERGRKNEERFFY